MKCLGILPISMALVLGATISTPIWGQSVRGPLQTEQLGSRLTGERVTRQSEIQRLRDEIDSLKSRVRRMERTSQSVSPIPAISVAEAEADIKVAEVRVAQRTQEFEEGRASKVEVIQAKAHLLTAQTQHKIAIASRQDQIIALETEVTYAKRDLAVETQKMGHLQRLVAKGYSTKDALELQSLDIDLLKRQLDRALHRLSLAKELANLDSLPSETETPVNQVK